MLVLPPEVTKEGQSANKVRLRTKRVPLRSEMIQMLEARRKDRGVTTSFGQWDSFSLMRDVTETTVVRTKESL